MVVLYSKEGQLANRLWQAAHFLANAIEYKYRLLHVGFSDYIEHFRESIDGIGSNISVKFVDEKEMAFSEVLLFRYISISEQIAGGLKLQLPFIRRIYFLEFSAVTYAISRPSFIKLCKRNIVLVDGWFFDDKEALMKQADFVRKTFTPNKIYKENINAIFQGFFLKYDIVVGVHIRRKDYRTYRNGTWFYSDEDYVLFIKKVQALTSFQNKSVAFFICSDEKINYSVFSHLNIIKSTSNIIEDLYTLSMCHYVIGPPSTYSAWASFYGKVPILHITDKGQNITEDLFKIMDYGC